MGIGSKVLNWLTSKPHTANYRQFSDHAFTQLRDLPIFTFDTIRAMMFDPTIRLGLAMRAAPLCQAQFSFKKGDQWVEGIRAEHPEVGEFVYEQLRRIWEHELHKLLTAQIWGWAGCEVTHRLVNGRVEVDTFLHRHARDVRALLKDGEVHGVRFERIRGIGGVELRFPRSIWHPFNPEGESPYGMSILKGSYSPWADKWLNGGGLDVRRLFMHKDAYGGVDITYPPGTTNIDGKGIVPNRDIAREIAEQIKAGGVTTRPAAYDQNGKPLWELTRATIPSSPQHILDYPKDLDTEILRGMEIPDDVITAEASGAWQGKQVPMQAFYTSADQWLSQVIRAVVTQILEPLVLLNWGSAIEFQVETKPLAEQVMDQIKQGGDEEQQQPGQQQPGQPPAKMSLDSSDAELLVGRGVVQASHLVDAAREYLKKKPKRMASSCGASGDDPPPASDIPNPADAGGPIPFALSKVKRMARAPKGGITIQGKEYVGGQFIPGEVLAEATPEERAAVEGEPKPEPKKRLTFDQLMETKTPSDAEAFHAAKSEGIAIPPAWTDVIYHGKGNNIIAEGRDAKGRRQRVEDATFRQNQILAKHQRISDTIGSRMDELRDRLRADATGSNVEAKVLYLIAQTGFRIGGKGDGKADKDAFGASTLLGQHVTVDGDSVSFDFPGKKGVRQQHTIEDPVIAAMMQDLKPDELIFKTSDAKVRAAWKTYGGQKVHDIRNVVATETAAAAIDELIPPPPKNKKEFVNLQKQVAEITAQKLGNRPSESLKTYINPAVFSKVTVA